MIDGADISTPLTPQDSSLSFVSLVTDVTINALRSREPSRYAYRKPDGIA